MKELPKVYNPSVEERGIYETWERSGFFNPDNLPVKKTAKPFSIALPPPNTTAELHLGHAVMVALQDILVRYHRMRGDRTLWLPGTDHAAIATQNAVEKQLVKEGIHKEDIGRDAFLDRVESYVRSSQGRIKAQIKRLGASLDWSRERFTLDQGLSRAVRAMFTKMYRDGLIYRSQRIVNWCPRCQSTLADDEVEYRETAAPFYYLKYGPVVIGTARPETKFHDKTIVVHPDDRRYRDLVGKTFSVDWIEGAVEATVIADPAADPNLGTGAMTLTPAHSFLDFELAKKYGLPIVQIIDESGRLTSVAGSFVGLPVAEARKRVVGQLRLKNLIDHVDEYYVHNLSVCYRCGTPVEPLVSKQWFVDVQRPVVRSRGKLVSLKDRALAAVETGDIRIIPERFLSVYRHWLSNLRDWCISRQIWYGHQIPVWERPIPRNVGRLWDLKLYGADMLNGILSGRKRFETRAGKPVGAEKDWRSFRIGDRIQFTAVNPKNEGPLGLPTVTKRIADIRHFPSLEDLLRHIRLDEIAPGYTLEAYNHTARYPGYTERIRKYGLWAFELVDEHAEVRETYVGAEPPPKAKLDITYFVHGTTTDNEHWKASGHFDADLSDLGVKQSHELKDLTQDQIFDVVFTSDLKRAIKTATIAFGDRLTIVKDRRLRECDYGDLTRSDARAFEQQEPNFIEKPFPNGESYREVEKRMRHFLANVARAYPGKRIAILAHKAPQLALEVITKGKTWGQALEEDWRKRKHWQPGWPYLYEPDPDSAAWKQSADTLDTWFSSGLWTFSTLGWPDETPDLNRYHPTDVLETGYDIIFFWVARMVIMSTYALDEIPFKTVYLHGLVRDARGRKMSKSLGNGIDPLIMVERYGADATRLALVIGSTPGNDVRLSEAKIAGQRNFVNKLWNVARFALLQGAQRTSSRIRATTLTDRWILSRLSAVVTETTRRLDRFEFSAAAEGVSVFAWHEFADWYLEIAKVESSPGVTRLVLETILKLLHPYLPFFTERVWQELHPDGPLLLIAPWPSANLRHRNDEVERTFAQFQATVRTLRSFKAHSGLLSSETGSMIGRAKDAVLLSRLSGIKLTDQPTPSATRLRFGTIGVSFPESRVRAFRAWRTNELERLTRLAEQKRAFLRNNRLPDRVRDAAGAALSALEEQLRTYYSIAETG